MTTITINEGLAWLEDGTSVEGVTVEGVMALPQMKQQLEYALAIIENSDHADDHSLWLDETRALLKVPARITPITRDSLWQRKLNKWRIKAHGVQRGVVSFAAEGGGFIKVCSVKTFLEDFEPALPIDQLPWRRSVVGIDGIYPGYPCLLRDQRWNGWECPMFERHVIDSMLGTFCTRGSRWDGDTFLMDYDTGFPDEDVTRSEKQVITVDGEPVEVWAVGDGFCWDEITPEQ